jgi:hypothetical protein
LTQEHEHNHIIIHINNKPYKAPKPQMTGKEIKELCGGPVEYTLFLVVKAPDTAPGGDDRQIGDNEVVKLEPGMHFRLVNPGTFG